MAEEPQRSGYRSRWVKWVAIYVAIAAVAYAIIYLVFFHHGGGGGGY